MSHSTCTLNTRRLRALDISQKSFPLVPLPFAELAQQLGDDWDEAELLALFHQAAEQGILSRLGAVFAPNTVGFSTLAALAIPPARLDEVAAHVSSYPVVNHNYQRDHHFNLWFVVTAATRQAIDQTLQSIQQQTGLAPLDLPLVREYHIDLGFALQGPVTKTSLHSLPSAASVESWQQTLLAMLTPGLPLQARPYLALAQQCGLTEALVLAQLAQWKQQGVIRRFGAILHHVRLGYQANAMCVWQIDAPDQREQIGRQLAAEPSVTLCYERPARPPLWPYQLFCMIHATSPEQLTRQLADINTRLTLQPYPHAVLTSLKRYVQRGACYGYPAI